MRRGINVQNTSKPRTCPICHTPNSFDDKTILWECSICKHIINKVPVNQGNVGNINRRRSNVRKRTQSIPQNQKKKRIQTIPLN